MNNYIFFQASMIELVNIDETSHEEVSVIFIKDKDFNMTENNHATEDDNVNCFQKQNKKPSYYIYGIRVRDRFVSQ